IRKFFLRNRLNARSYPPQRCLVIPPARRPVRLSPCSWLWVQTVCPLGRPLLTESPFACAGCYPSQGGSITTSESITPPSTLLRAHAPHPPPPADFSFALSQPVFAGAASPLLAEGGSRCYLHNPCIGAW